MKALKLWALAGALLIGAAAVPVMPVTAFADVEKQIEVPTSGKCGDNCTWSYDAETKTLTISGTGEMDDWGEVQGQDEWKETPWYSLSEKVKAVVIEEGVTSVGSSAFSGWMGIETVTLPESLTSIGQRAFESCDNLTSINFPKNVTEIGYGAFSYCGFESLEIPEGIAAIESCAFSYCKIKSVSIPESVTVIKKGAFLYCESLTEVEIPKSVEIIEDNAFWSCTKLKKVTILNPKCEIEGAPFNTYGAATPEYQVGCIVCGYDNSTAEEFAAPYGQFESLGAAPEDTATSGKCGENCTWSFDEETKTLTISGEGEMFDVGFYPEQASMWSRWSAWDAYAGTAENVVVEEGITSISKCAFLFFSKLESVSLPSTLQSIGPEAFSGTPWLDSLLEQNPVVIVDDYLIDAQTYSEAELTIPDGTKLIAGGAFMENQDLKTVKIPDSVTGIGTRAFQNCTALEKVILPEQLDWMGGDVFEGTPFLEANTSKNDFTVLGSALIQVPAGETDIEIPENVSVIADFADFADAKNVVFPENITRIGRFSYYSKTKLESIIVKNPACVFSAEDNEPYFAGTICGYDNSTAQEYAEKRGYTFESLGEAPAKDELATGDLDGDGEIGVTDAQLALNAYVQGITGADDGLTDAQRRAVDADGDGELTITDAQLILNYYVQNTILGVETDWAELL